MVSLYSKFVRPVAYVARFGVGAMYQEVAAYTKEGNLGEFLWKNITYGQKASLYWALGAGRFWQTVGLFLMGLYIGRKQLFVSSETNTRFWVKALIISAIAFAPLFQLKELVMASDSLLVRGTVGTAFDMWQKFAFTVVLVASFVLLYQKEGFKKFVSNLRFYGKMSLSNYIGQSIAGAVIYFPFGLDALPQDNWKTEVWKDGIGNIDEEHNGLGAFKSEYSFPYAKHVDAKHTIQRWFVEKTRLGIPVDFTNEGIRGLCHDRATYFPAQCGQGATWNKKLIARIGEVEAKEAVALGYTNIYSPILDIAQDPRWGRCVETYGEDPYLVGELGKQMITSLQKYNLVATPKHFAVYSIPVGGRDGKTRTDPHVAPREMRTLYIEPFRMAFQEAGALGVMSSYNDYDGEPITGSYHFLTEILRQEWGFKGYVVSDSEAVEFISNKHKVADTYEDGIAQAVNTGLNIRTHFTPPADFILPLRKAVDDGKISQETLDKRVAEILRIKFWLGLFDNPYRGNGKQAEQIVHSKEHQAVSLEAARQSLVLLKNETHLLPLSKSVRSIAVIGPNADEQTQLICRYGPANAPTKTVYQGIKELLPHAEVIYKKGCDIIDPHFPESEIGDITCLVSR